MIIQGLLAIALAVVDLAPAAAATAGEEMSSPPMAARSVIMVAGPQATGGTGRAISEQSSAATGYLSAELYPSAVPARPHYVAGYTNHALERMAQRGITKAEVEALVASPDPGYYQDDNDTWLIRNEYLIVVINRNAWIVTGIKGQM